MATPVTTTTEEDDIILRFLAAAKERMTSYDLDIDRKEALKTIGWLKQRVGRINDDGSAIR